MAYIIHKDLSYAVQGLLFDVHNTLGPKLPESFYQDAMTYTLTKRGIACIPEKQFQVSYREIQIGSLAVDLWIEDGDMILELKVGLQIQPIHLAQAISYLKVSDADLAIVANFGAEMRFQRLPNLLRNKQVKFQWKPRATADNIPYPDLTNNMMKALYRVHFEVGPGYIHRIYRRAVMIELEYQRLSYEHIRQIAIYYEARFLGMQPTQMINVENKVLLGVFAVKVIDKTMRIEMRSRLKRLGMKLGMLANFHGEQLRVVVVR